METVEIHPIAHMRSDFPTKFGIPRQSGLVDELRSMIVFAPEYRNADALRGIEDYSHLWLIWQFSQTVREGWSPTVRPPRLGGNTRMGVFATRSPFRPNPLGLSCVRLLGVEETAREGTVLRVAGADLLDGTPIYDIKPYVAYADSHAGVRSGFVDSHPMHRLQVVIPAELVRVMGAERATTLRQVLALDPRPHYHHDANKVYGMPYEGHDVRFRVEGDVLTVVEVL